MIKSVTRAVIVRTLSRVAWVALAALAAFAFRDVQAQSTDSCSTDGTNWYQYRINNAAFGGVSAWMPSKNAGCSYAESYYCGANPGAASCTVARRPWTGQAGSNYCKRADGVNLNVGMVHQVMTDPVTQCPSNALECNMPSNPETGLANFWDASGPVADSIACDVGSQCLAAKRPGTTTCGPTTCGAIYDWIDTPCNGSTIPEGDTPPPLADPDAPAPAERCTTIGTVEYCAHTGGPDGDDAQCGFLNDVWICLPATPANGCQAVSGGGMLCDPAANAPPAPDNGTPGTEATPDGQVSASPAGSDTPTDYNYYDNSTVNNSSGPTYTGNTPSGNDQDGDGFTDGEEEDGPQGTASGGGTCAAAPVCEGDAIACAQLEQEWMARCPIQETEGELLNSTGLSGFEEGFEGNVGGSDEVELPAALSESGWWSVSGCPAGLAVNIMGQSLNLDIWQYGCSMAANFAPLVMGISYLIAAFMLIGRHT